MAIKRKKLDRKITPKIGGNTLVEMRPKWVFNIFNSEYGEIEFDFNKFKENDREEIAGHFRDAIWSLRHESSGASIASYKESIRKFWRFLDSAANADIKITRLMQVDRECINRYLLWLETQTIPITHKDAGKLLSNSTKRTTYNGLKTILINRQKFAPSYIHPLLSFPQNPFPNANKLSPGREPYSPTEYSRILKALNQDLRTLYEAPINPFTPLQILVIHILVLASSTGLNLQPLLELKRDSLSLHPLPDRELLVTHKRRGWTTFSTSTRKSNIPREKKSLNQIPLSIGDHFRALCNFTEPLTHEVDNNNKEYVFLWKVPSLGRKGQVIRLQSQNVKSGVRDFNKRHTLLNDKGNALELNFARFRPTFATDLYRRTGDILKVSQALGHSSVETTARSYAKLPVEFERNHALVVEGLVGQFAKIQLDGKTLIAADGQVPVQNMKDLLKNGYSTGIARCKNPFRDEDSVCKKFLSCFSCPSMMVFEDDLWRLYSFYYRLLSERTKLKPDHWLKTFGPIIRRIDNDIAPQFPSAKVEEAKLRAQADPHPTWKGLSL